jgi:crossover junction endodeoxyribonuclease RusA
METVTFRVVGLPAPQGSKRHVGNGRMIEASKKVGPWRAAVVEAVASLFFEPFSESVHVDMVFFLEKPKTVKRVLPTVPPDLDKLVRGLFDAMTGANVWVDDSLAVSLTATKVYCEPGQDPGAEVTLFRV